jgi:alcohol dehydrogenase (cytochrome c)
MNATKTAGLAVAAAVLAGICPLATQAGEVTSYAPVTQQRLENPEPGNWLMYRRSYDGHMYSPLSQINATNVKDLVPLWSFSTGVIEGHEAPPFVNNGIMFVATPSNQVIALDAKTGDYIWRYKKKTPEDLFQLHPTSRGVGMWQDKLFFASTDDYLVALDAKTGKELWTTKVGDYKAGYYMTLAPLVVDGKVMVGQSGGEFGIRGYVSAYSADDGKELWKTFTIPAPGEPGHDTWSGDDWKTGGGSAWQSGNYDPKRKMVLWGVGNAAPWPGDAHPGDNLYTSSVIALNPDNGKLTGYYQFHRNDSWDWDEMDPPILVDNLKYGGNTISGLVHPARDGYLYVVDNAEDGMHFLHTQPYVEQNAYSSVDAKGHQTYDPAHTPVIGKTIDFCPSLWGGKDFVSATWNDKNNILVIPAQNHMCGQMLGEKLPYQAGMLWLGATIPSLQLIPDGDHIGELQGWDVANNKQLWVHNFPAELFTSVTSTGGDLAFLGGTPDRKFRAFNVKTGDLLWEITTNSGIMAPPSVYEVDGTEYVAVESGWGVDGQRIQDSLSKTKMKLDANAVPQGGVVWVFGLKK